MHIRCTAARGVHVLDDQSQHVAGIIIEPLIDPDIGKIEGFFILGNIPDLPADLYLAAHDILSWGSHVHIRSSDTLSPPGDIIRLQSRLSDPRTFLGQKIRVRSSGASLGRCADVQFDTKNLTVEWLFPKKLFFYRQPIPASEIIEVTEEAIWVRSPLRPVEEKRADKNISDVLDVVSEVVPLHSLQSK